MHVSGGLRDGFHWHANYNIKSKIESKNTFRTNTVKFIDRLKKEKLNIFLMKNMLVAANLLL